MRQRAAHHEVQQAIGDGPVGQAFGYARRRRCACRFMRRASLNRRQRLAMRKWKSWLRALRSKAFGRIEDGETSRRFVSSTIRSIALHSAIDHVHFLLRCSRRFRSTRWLQRGSTESTQAKRTHAEPSTCRRVVEPETREMQPLEGARSVVAADHAALLALAATDAVVGLVQRCGGVGLLFLDLGNGVRGARHWHERGGIAQLGADVPDASLVVEALLGTDGGLTAFERLDK
jgi:hypothetical protein